MKKQEYLLEEWAPVTAEEPYLAPELRKRFLLGRVYGNPNFEEGKYVKTSSIKGWDGECVITNSGSRYKLGDVNANYETKYSNAKERFIKNLIAYTESE